MESKPEKRRRRTAGWIGFPGLSLWGVLRTIEWLFSLGGTFGNADGWRKAGLVMLSAMPPWLMPVLLAGSGVAIVIYLVGVVPELYGKSRHRILTLAATPDGIKRLSTVINIAGVAVLVALLGGLIYFLFFVYERPKWIWTHPTLSPAEQAKATAVCEMAAYDAIGGGGGVASPKASDRYDYKFACLTAEGFSRERIDG